MAEIDAREAKLPRWALELLTLARIRADRAETRLKEHLDTVEPSPIWYGDYKNKIYVPAPRGYQTVHFSMTGSPSGRTYDEIDISLRNEKLHVNGGHTIAIEPIAANCFDVRFRGGD